MCDTDLAQQTIAALTPYLLAAAGKTAETVRSKATDELYNWVKQKLTREAAASTLKEAEAEPDEANLEMLRLQIQKELKENKDFRKGLKEALAAAGVEQHAKIKGSNNKIAQASGSNISIKM